MDESRSRRSVLDRVRGRLRQRRDPKAPHAELLPAELDRAGSSAPPVFVIGCQRSGTSLLRRVLDSHPSIACPPESKFILPTIGILRDRAALQGLDSMGYPRHEVAKAIARFVSGFFEGYARAQGKPRWADKTPNYVDCLPELWELFGPRARFLVIVRNGLDVAYSLSDPDRRYPAIEGFVREANGSVPVGAGRFWVEQNRKIGSFQAEHPDACLMLRYEDLTERPEDTLRSMFAFLGEPWEPSVLEYDRFPHHEGLEDPDVRRRRRIEPNSGRSAEWPPETLRAVREACEPLLSALGYA